MIYRIAAILILAAFYGIYIGKMLMQRRKGIQTDQIAKGSRKDKTYYINEDNNKGSLMIEIKHKKINSE